MTITSTRHKSPGSSFPWIAGRGAALAAQAGQPGADAMPVGPAPVEAATTGTARILRLCGSDKRRHVGRRLVRRDTLQHPVARRAAREGRPSGIEVEGAHHLFELLPGVVGREQQGAGLSAGNLAPCHNPAIAGQQDPLLVARSRDERPIGDARQIRRVIAHQAQPAHDACGVFVHQEPELWPAYPSYHTRERLLLHAVTSWPALQLFSSSYHWQAVPIARHHGRCKGDTQAQEQLCSAAAWLLCIVSAVDAILLQQRGTRQTGVDAIDEASGACVAIIPGPPACQQVRTAPAGWDT